MPPPNYLIFQHPCLLPPLYLLAFSHTFLCGSVYCQAPPMHYKFPESSPPLTRFALQMEFSSVSGVCSTLKKINQWLNSCKLSCKLCSLSFGDSALGCSQCLQSLVCSSHFMNQHWSQTLHIFVISLVPANRRNLKTDARKKPLLFETPWIVTIKI